MFEIKNKNTSVISLGCDCFTRAFTTVTGLKPRKADGELSMPFDLSWSSTEALVHNLRTDFKDYFDNIVYDNENGNYMNNKYIMRFNHDTDCENTKEGYEKLKQRYESRIQNFRECLKSDNYLLFIYNAPPNTEHECNEIFDIISSKILNQNFKLIILDMNEKINKALLNDNIALCAIKHPFNRSNEWWLKENVDKCMEYYQKCGNAVKKIIAETKQVI